MLVPTRSRNRIPDLDGGTDLLERDCTSPREIRLRLQKRRQEHELETRPAHYLRRKKYRFGTSKRGFSQRHAVLCNHCRKVEEGWLRRDPHDRRQLQSTRMCRRQGSVLSLVALRPRAWLFFREARTTAGERPRRPSVLLLPRGGSAGAWCRGPCRAAKNWQPRMGSGPSRHAA